MPGGCCQIAVVRLTECHLPTYSMPFQTPSYAVLSEAVLRGNVEPLCGPGEGWSPGARRTKCHVRTTLQKTAGFRGSRCPLAARVPYRGRGAMVSIAVSGHGLRPTYRQKQ